MIATLYDMATGLKLAKRQLTIMHYLKPNLWPLLIEANVKGSVCKTLGTTLLAIAQLQSY